MLDVMTKNIKIFLLSLFKQGIYNFVVSPGSRSTPLVLLLAELATKDPQINLYIDVDERSASFFGVGIAKKTNSPVALICTSGTAATEYSSAVAEAHLSHLPLVVITTDRPMELTNIGAPQAIDQVDLYQNNTKAFVELTLQDPAKTVPSFVEFETQRIVIQSQQQPKGPVQINLPFRKPLMPTFETDDPKIDKIEVDDSTTSFDFSWMQKMNGKKVLLIAGPTNSRVADQLMSLSQAKNMPLIADVLSNVRGKSDNVIGNFNSIIKDLSESELTKLKPDFVLKFGGTLVSAAISKWLTTIKDSAQIMNFSNDQLTDHTLSSSLLVNGDESDLISSIKRASWQADVSYLKQIVQLDASAKKIKQEFLKSNFSEMSVAETLDDFASEQANIFLSNSMPVRDFEDYFFGKSGQTIYCNRGANGIDGVVSSALGTSLNSTENYLVIGDLAMFHDMNGLMMAKRYQIPLKIIVINNNGGGIFSFLPQSKATDYFEQLFGTPQDLDFHQVADLYDFSYHRVTDRAALKKSLSDDSTQSVIEVVSDRNKNLQQHHAIDEMISRGLING